jgi:O-antigen ligase
VIFDPTNGIEQSNAFELKNAWKGILNQKNTLGGTAAIATYFWTVFNFNERIKPSISIATLIICLTCLVMARSSTSITLAGASIFIFLILRKDYIQSDLWLLRLFFFVALVTGIYLHIFYLAIAPIAEMFGKGVDLSGRSAIWKHMWIEIDLHWLNGYGYGAFWVDPPERFKANFPYVFYQAHNGYIDVINDLGLIGLFLFLGFLVFHAFNLYRLFLSDQHSAAFHAGLLTMYLLSNITESSAMQALSIFHIFIIISFFLVAHQVGQQVTLHNQPMN